MIRLARVVALGLAAMLFMAPHPVRAGETVTAVAADSLSVPECVALARGHAPAVLAAQFDRAAALADSTATSMNARPAQSLLAGATVAPKGFFDPTITNLGDYQLKLAMAWTAADGGSRARARERSAWGAAAARTRAMLETREAGVLAADLAFKLLRTQQEIALQRQGIEWLDRLGRLVGAGVTAGMRGSSDSIRVALERDVVAAALDAARLEAQTTGFELANLIGRDLDAPLTIREPGEASGRGPERSDSTALIASIDSQPELALARVDEMLGRLDVQDARRRNAPAVQVVVDAGLAGADLTRKVPLDLQAEHPSAGLGDRLRRDLGASAAVQFQLPLLDRAAPSAVSAREAALRAAQLRRSAELGAQRRRAATLLAQWRGAWRQLDAAERTQARAERSLLKVRSLYTAGATPLLDLLDAWRVVTDARERWVSARQENAMAQLLVEDRR